MPIYRDQIFPRIYDLLMGLGSLDSRRTAHLTPAKGKVLEVGIGTGLNLPHYPETFGQLTGLDASRGMLDKLEAKARKMGFELNAVLAGAEMMPFEDQSFDTVVSTHSLCSMSDRAAALGEIRRVLKSDGRFIFLEHGLSPDQKIAKWQRRVNGVQSRFAVGCLLDVDMEAEIRAAGFCFEKLEKGYQPGESRTHGYLYDGIAVPV